MHADHISDKQAEPINENRLNTSLKTTLNKLSSSMNIKKKKTG
jgi:hypothetical protein